MLTCTRILCAFLIIGIPAFSAAFYIFYILGGLTDAIDGTVARVMKQESEAGARLDAIADICFVLTVLFKILNSIYLPPWLLIWIGSIAVIKAANIVMGFAARHVFPAIHNLANKICGVLLFIVPLTIGHFPWQGPMLLIIFTCTFATFAAVLEGIEINKSRKEDGG